MQGPGATFIIIASGPSLNQADVNACQGKGTVIVINDNYKLAPWADYLYYCDRKWFNWHKDDPEFLAFKGQKITQYQSDRAQDELQDIVKDYNIVGYRSESKPGLSDKRGVIHQGSNSGYQAINLAYHLGAKRIILLGYDMQLQGDKAHWFGDHPDKVRSSYDAFRNQFNNMAPDAKAKGLEIINCTRSTALTCFERMSLEQALSLEQGQA